MKLQPLNSPLLENLEPMLNESIYHFLVEFQKGRTDFSELGSIFFRLTQTMTDPPLEFIWFYSALTFQTAKSSNLRDSHNFLLSIKDLFHSLLSFRSPSDSSYLKQVSLVAPVLYQLVNFKFLISTFKTEIEGLVDAIVSHIVLCCNNDLAKQEVPVYKSSVNWIALVPIWIADQVRENQGRVDGLQLFFPLSTEDIRQGINEDSGMSYLAAIVMIQSFLLKLCLMFDSESSRTELQKDIKSYAAQIIKGFKKNPTFLVMLFKVLLEPSLPVTKLLTTPDEVVLRGLLFDVTLDLGSFLNCDTSTWLSDVQYKEIVILWLFVTNSALQFASEKGDHAVVSCYMNGFLTSQLPHQIISWVTSVTNTQPTTPDISSPKDLIGWLMDMEKHGLKICEQSISGLHEKILKSTGVNNGVKDKDGIILDAPIQINGRRKRDNMGFEGDVQKQFKVIKYCHENHGDNKTEVGNADQEMVDMVHC